MNHPRRYAFTLIELLIVVAIIAILISILMPTLRLFTIRVQESKCQANLSSVHRIMMAYCEKYDGRFPSLDTVQYNGDGLGHPYSGWPYPTIEPWAALSDVRILKELGAKADIFFCPFDPRSSDKEDKQFRSWEEPVLGKSNWYNNSGDTKPYGPHYVQAARVYSSYHFLFSRGWAPQLRGWGGFRDGRGSPLNIGVPGNTPMVADILHASQSGGATGWYHGGGNIDGLFNAGCNTLMVGGTVIWKSWPELEGQGPGLVMGSNMWYFWLGLRD